MHLAWSSGDDQRKGGGALVSLCWIMSRIVLCILSLKLKQTARLGCHHAMGAAPCPNHPPHPLPRSHLHAPEICSLIVVLPSCRRARKWALFVMTTILKSNAGRGCHALIARKASARRLLDLFALFLNDIGRRAWRAALRHQRGQESSNVSKRTGRLLCFHDKAQVRPGHRCLLHARHILRGTPALPLSHVGHAAPERPNHGFEGLGCSARALRPHV